MLSKLAGGQGLVVTKARQAALVAWVFAGLQPQPGLILAASLFYTEEAQPSSWGSFLTFWDGENGF